MGESHLAPPPPSSVHRALGAGSVADILLWRWWSASVLVLISATSLWLLFEYGGYNPLSFVANVLLLLVAILFFWAKSASILNRPLPPVPDLEITDVSAEKAAEQLRVWINHILSIAREIAVGGNLRVLVQVAASLWLVSYIGSLCDFLTLIYVGILLCFTLPVLYEKYQDPIDHRLFRLHNAVLVPFRKFDGSFLSRIPFPMYRGKQKKDL